MDKEATCIQNNNEEKNKDRLVNYPGPITQDDINAVFDNEIDIKRESNLVQSYEEETDHGHNLPPEYGVTGVDQSPIHTSFSTWDNYDRFIVSSDEGDDNAEDLYLRSLPQYISRPDSSINHDSPTEHDNGECSSNGNLAIIKWSDWGLDQPQDLERPSCIPDKHQPQLKLKNISNLTEGFQDNEYEVVDYDNPKPGPSGIKTKKNPVIVIEEDSDDYSDDPYYFQPWRRKNSSPKRSFDNNKEWWSKPKRLSMEAVRKKARNQKTLMIYDFD